MALPVGFPQQKLHCVSKSLLFTRPQTYVTSLRFAVLFTLFACFSFFWCRFRQAKAQSKWSSSVGFLFLLFSESVMLLILIQMITFHVCCYEKKM